MTDFQYGSEPIRNPCPDGTAACDRVTRECWYPDPTTDDAHVCHDWIHGALAVHCPGYAHMPKYGKHTLLADAAKYEEVAHPAHYGGKDNPYELLKVALAWEDMFGLSNMVFQAIKYLVRNGRKPGVSGKQDLQKAIFYIQKEIEHKYPDPE